VVYGMLSVLVQHIQDRVVEFMEHVWGK
jgi:hypothetical protein